MREKPLIRVNPKTGAWHIVFSSFIGSTQFVSPEAAMSWLYDAFAANWLKYHEPSWYRPLPAKLPRAYD
jgi:hypothetical protein